MYVHVELENRAGKEEWVLIRAVDLPHYKKSAVVKLRKRVRDLEQEVVLLKKQAKCAEGIMAYTYTYAINVCIFNWHILTCGAGMIIRNVLCIASVVYSCCVY